MFQALIVKKARHLGLDGTPTFPQAPTNNDILVSQHEYLKAFTMDAIQTSTCAICGRETLVKSLSNRRFGSLDQSLLWPLHPHSDMVRFNGCLIDLSGIVTVGTNNDNLILQSCQDCDRNLDKKKRPYYSLARGTWVGNVPIELKNLTYAEELLIGLAKTSVQVIKLYAKGRCKGDPSTLQ